MKLTVNPVFWWLAWHHSLRSTLFRGQGLGSSPISRINCQEGQRGVPLEDPFSPGFPQISRLPRLPRDRRWRVGCTQRTHYRQWALENLLTRLLQQNSKGAVHHTTCTLAGCVYDIPTYGESLYTSKRPPLLAPTLRDFVFVTLHVVYSSEVAKL